MAAKKSNAKSTETNGTTEGVYLRPLSPDTTEAFRTFMDALAADSIFDPSDDNEIRQGAKAYDEKRFTAALPNIATMACRAIREREKRLQAFGETALADAHAIFNVVPRNPITMGELMARLGAKHGLHASQEHEYQTKLEAVMASEPAQFGIALDLVYRLRDENGRETNEKRTYEIAVENAENMNAEPPKRRRRKPGSEATAKRARKTGSSDVNAPARGRFVGVIKKAIGADALTGAQQSAIIAALNGVKVNAATKAQLQAAAKAAGVK